ADYLAVALLLLAQEHRHLVGRHGRRGLEAEVLHPLADFLRLHRFADLGGEALGDLLGRAGRGSDADPGADVVARDLGRFGERWRVRKGRAAARGAEAEEL